MTQSRTSIGAKKNPATETAILDAAARLLDQKGIAGLRMETVAREARAGKATLYRWWPTRGALLLAVFQRKKITLAGKDTGSLFSDLIAFAAELSKFWKTKDGGYVKAIIAEAQSDPELAQALRNYHAEHLEVIKTIFARAIARGDLPSDSNLSARSELVFSFLWLRMVTGRLDESFEEQIRLLAKP